MIVLFSENLWEISSLMFVSNQNNFARAPRKPFKQVVITKLIAAGCSHSVHHYTLCCFTTREFIGKHLSYTPIPR